MRLSDEDTERLRTMSGATVIISATVRTRLVNELLLLRSLVTKAEDKVVNCGCDECIEWFEDFKQWKEGGV